MFPCSGSTENYAVHPISMDTVETQLVLDVADTQVAMEIDLPETLPPPDYEETPALHRTSVDVTKTEPTQHEVAEVPKDTFQDSLGVSATQEEVEQPSAGASPPHEVHQDPGKEESPEDSTPSPKDEQEVPAIPPSQLLEIPDPEDS